MSTTTVLPGNVHLVNCCSTTTNVARLPAAAASSDSGVEVAWVEMCSGSSLTLSDHGFHLVVGLEGVNLPATSPLPDGICLDMRRVPSLHADSPVLAMYHTGDSFKTVKDKADVRFCGVPMQQWLEERRLTGSDIWTAASNDDEDDAAPSPLTENDLWTGQLFAPHGAGASSSSALFIAGYWDSSVGGDASWKEAFLAAPRYSLQQLQVADSALARDERRTGFFLKRARAENAGCSAGLFASCK